MTTLCGCVCTCVCTCACSILPCIQKHRPLYPLSLGHLWHLLRVVLSLQSAKEILKTSNREHKLTLLAVQPRSLAEVETIRQIVPRQNRRDTVARGVENDLDIRGAT